jgi:hypothetical protein
MKELDGAKKDMDADIERFFAECRVDSSHDPEIIDDAEEAFRALYRLGDESPVWQEVWDRTRKIISSTERPLKERLSELIPMLKGIVKIRESRH